MTREELLKEINNIFLSKDRDIARRLINKIFDDFENKNKEVKEFTFTTCNDCKHKINGYFQEECISCKRYYACHFEKKQ